jgi:hypothetical protein
VKAGADGKWSLELATALRDGAHTFTVTATDAAGNASAQSNSWSVVVDTNVATPTITSVIDNVGASTGNIPSGGTTDDRTPTLVGKAEANSIVTIYDGTTAIGSVKANSSGDWSFTTNELAYNSSHNFNVSATDAAGNTSVKSSNWDVNIGSNATSYFWDFNDQSQGLMGWRAAGSYATGGANGQDLRWEYGKIEAHTDNVNLSWSGTVMYIYVSVVAGVEYELGLNWRSSGFSNFPENYALIGMRINNQQVFTYPEMSGKWVSNVTGTVSLAITNARDTGWGNDFALDDIYLRPTTTRSLFEVQSDDESTLNATTIDDSFTDNRESHVSSELLQSHYDEIHQTLSIAHAEQPMNFNTLAESNATVITVDMANGEASVLNISLGDILAHGEEHAFTADDTKQLMIKGDAGDVVNLTDLLPDGTDPGNWAKAEGTVTVGGVQYEVYQHSGADTELLVQLGVQTNLNNH